MNRMNFFVAAATACFAVGCVLPADIAEIQKNQQTILAKLEAIEKAGAAAAPAPARRRRADPSQTYALPVADAPTLGPGDAWVTLIEIGDFQCPFCKRVQPTLEGLKKKYGDDLRIAFKHNALSFHNRAKPAAMASECAREQGKFWEMHDLLFENNRALGDADLEQYAQRSKLDMAQWKSCYQSNKHSDRIDAQQREVTALGASGTPAFFINGRALSGAQPQANFERIIDDELKKAKASGVAKGEYYEKQVLGKGKKKL